MTDATSFHILPAIDLRGGRVVRLQQGDFARETVYSGDPVAVARGFADAGARWLHVVDLDGAREGKPVNGSVVSAIVGAVGARLHVEAAGGLRTRMSIGGTLHDGARRVVVGTAALRDTRFARALVSHYGAGRIVVALDVRDGRALGEGWHRSAAGIPVEEAMSALAAVGVMTFEVTAIDHDGILGGPDLALYERLVALQAGSVIASGGIANLDDLRAVRDVGCTGAIVGRALLDGSMDLRAAIAVSASLPDSNGSVE